MVRPRLINRSFEAVLQMLNNIPNINYGGCGISTLAMYRWLETYYPEFCNELQIVYLYRNYGVSTFDNNSKRIVNNDYNMEVAQHICLLWNGYYIDSSGRIDIKEYAREHSIPDVKYLIHTINTPNGDSDWQDHWNDEFIRCMYLKKIEEDLKINLSDIAT